ncbi:MULTISPECIES: hypothetical protein [Clostridium]|nr:MULTISPECIES: hypothetical protein [Clostridium]
MGWVVFKSRLILAYIKEVLISEIREVIEVKFKSYESNNYK